MIATSAGKVIKWDESEARPLGRGTMGVKGITLSAGAHALCLEIAHEGASLLVITEHGYGKRTRVEEYPEQHRGGQGVFTINMTAKKGLLVDCKIVDDDDEIMIMSEEGVVVRTQVSGITEQGRSTQGLKIMNVASSDKVSVVALTNKRQDVDDAEGSSEQAKSAEGADAPRTPSAPSAPAMDDADSLAEIESAPNDDDLFE